MTGPDPLNDQDLDRLLAHGSVPTPSPDLASRIVAEATRADRVRTIATPAPRRIARRPWPRRTVIGLIAINLFAVSAIAAAFGGHEGFKRLSVFSAQVIHSIAAVIPHRHKIEPPVHHSREHVHPPAMTTMVTPGASLAQVHSEPEPRVGPRLRPPPVVVRPVRAMVREQRVERIANHRAERRALYPGRRAYEVRPMRAQTDRRRANRSPGTREPGSERPRRMITEAPRSFEPPIARGIGVGDHTVAPPIPRDESSAFEPLHQSNSGKSTFRERREARLAQRDWRQRGEFSQGRRNGGFRPRRWRR